MKKVVIFLVVAISSAAIIGFGFTFSSPKNPNNYYRVYLDNKVLGTIKSKTELEEYIDKQGDYIKNKYDVNKVYAPKNLEVKKITTYEQKVDDVSSIYDTIQKMAPFTIDGYRFSIIADDKEKVIYTKSKKVFDEAVEKVIKTFVGEEEYQNYKNDNQSEIVDTGTIIENIYIEEEITVKEDKIAIENKIYSDADDLANYLLFGENPKQKQYIVKTSDTIEQISFDNKISAEEFLISNPSITSKNDLLFNGQKVIIKETNPEIDVIVEEHVVKDVVSKYRIEEQTDSSKLEGYDKVVQKGVNGLERVTQKVRLSNNEILYVDPISKEELEPTINQIVVKGSKVVSGVASGDWTWPTNSGYTIASDFGYRIDPIRNTRLLHDGIDISGTGYGSPIYAANNGVIAEMSYHYMNGNYIVINHNNGYYTIYAHMSGFNTSKGAKVEKGQVIGYIGSTGYSTGPHLHFGLSSGGMPYMGGTMISPWTVLR